MINARSVALKASGGSSNVGFCPLGSGWRYNFAVTNTTIPGTRRTRRVFEHAEALGLLLIAVVVLIVTVVRFYLVLQASTH